MAWSLSEIQAEWLNGAPVPYPAGEVLRAFNAAERVRGRGWVLGTIYGSNGWRQSGFAPFLRVYQFGIAIEALPDAQGSDTLLERLSQYEMAAESELAAIYLLRSRSEKTEVEIAPEVKVGNRSRLPDFRIRSEQGDWTYVEVTQLNHSRASERAQATLHRIVDEVSTISSPFLMEIIFWRERSRMKSTN